MNFVTFGFYLLLVTTSQAEEFKTLIKQVEKHPAIQAARQNFSKRAFNAEAQSALQDPKVKFSAVNLPTGSLRFDKTPMSSKQVVLSQQLPITTRLGHLGDQADHLHQAGKSYVQHQIVRARAELWVTSANLESLDHRLNIIKDSLLWVEQVEKSTQRLYSTGKTNQINLLEIKIRRAELKTQIHELSYQIETARSQIGYLVGQKLPMTVINVPWNRLTNVNTATQLDNMEASLKEQSLAAKSKLKASRLAYIPDLTLGAAYSFRENIDNQGDFVTGFVQFSLPLWGATGEKINIARSATIEQRRHFENYKLQKSKMQHSLSQKLNALTGELDLISKSIEFAETERKLATKRYSLGRVSVFELLEIELKLRQKKSKREIITEELRKTLVELLVFKGDNLDV